MRVLVLILAMVLCACQDATQIVENNGDEIAVRTGDRFDVTLEGNPTTGYDWYVDETDESVVTLADRSFEPSSSAIGAGGMVTLTFEAVGPGTAHVRLVYERSFEEVEPLEDFTFTVSVS